MKHDHNTYQFKHMYGLSYVSRRFYTVENILLDSRNTVQTNHHPCDEFTFICQNELNKVHHILPFIKLDCVHILWSLSWNMLTTLYVSAWLLFHILIFYSSLLTIFRNDAVEYRGLNDKCVQNIEIVFTWNNLKVLIYKWECQLCYNNWALWASADIW